jgi:cytochrome c oxidase assembly protein subunit 15
VVVKYQPDDLVKWMVILTLGLILTQTLLGTQVRENIDIVAIQSGEVYRSQWISMLGDSFYFHRSLSLLCFASIAYMSFLAKKVYSKNSLIFQYCLVLILLTSIQIGSGKILDNFGVPKMAQSAHLFIGSLIAGTQLFIAILAFTKTEKNIRTA